MGILGFLLGWDHRVRRLRRRWDRIREKSLKKHGPLRKEILTRLDSIESSIRTLEEQSLNRITRARIAKEAEICLEEVGAMLKAGEKELEEYKAAAGAGRNQAQNSR